MVGGLHRAGGDDITATMDLLSLTELARDREPLERAQDLLISHVTRGCERHQQEHRADRMAQIAVSSLQTLLLRPMKNSRKAAAIRGAAIAAARHRVTTDAVRKREDKIINEIAQSVFDELQNQRDNQPQSLEAAIHNLVPIASDLRQQLHDLLCTTYDGVQPADPRERRVVDDLSRQTVVELGALLVASTRLAELGLSSPRMTEDDYFFVRHARYINDYLFDQAADDRQFMRDFMRSNDSDGWQERLEHLRASRHGAEIIDRTLAWLASCYPICEFERSIEILRMCSPHALVTLLYDVEIRYLTLGLSDLDIAGNVPVLHHRVASPTKRSARG